MREKLCNRFYYTNHVLSISGDITVDDRAQIMDVLSAELALAVSRVP